MQLKLLGVVIPTRNNLSELSETLLSIPEKLDPIVVLTIVDSSVDPVGLDWVRERCRPNTEILLIHTRPEGIYSALNKGAAETQAKWLVMMTAGDSFDVQVQNIEAHLEKSTTHALVFSQRVLDPVGQSGYIFTPTPQSIWPTQSVFFTKTIFNELGPFDEKFSSISDQLFFQKVKKHGSFALEREVFSNFKTGGLSSTVSGKVLTENYHLFRSMGLGKGSSLLRIIRGVWRRLLERIFGQHLTNKIRAMIFSNYNRSE